MIRVRSIRVAGALALVLALGGCVSILPKAPPVQLYRFGGGAAMALPSSTAPSRRLVLTGLTLSRASAGDGLLTVRGDTAAYIAGARWISPAQVLMQEAVERAFAERAPSVRLLRRTDASGAQGQLSLEVTTFEIRYPDGGGPPVATLTLRATLARSDGAPLAQTTLTAAQPAAENRVGPIVTACDAAIAQVLTGLTAWVAAAPLG